MSRLFNYAKLTDMEHRNEKACARTTKATDGRSDCFLYFITSRVKRYKDAKSL